MLNCNNELEEERELNAGLAFSEVQLDQNIER